MSSDIRIATREDYAKGIPIYLPAWLSDEHTKRYRYGQEAYFQEAWQTLLEHGDTQEWLRSHTYILLKPDTFPPRAAERIINEIVRAGFDVLDIAPVTLDRFGIRELWRYEYNIATVQRYRLLDMFLSSGPSLVLLLTDREPSAVASERLTSLKGPSNPVLRAPHSIRTRIEAREGALNFIHTPDTPIDLVRELGVLLPSGELHAMVHRSLNLRSLAASTIDDVVARTNAEYAEHPLLIEAIVKRLGVSFAMELRQRSSQLSSNTYAQVDALASEYGLNVWDRVTLINRYLQFCVPGVSKVFNFEVPEPCCAIA